MKLLFGYGTSWQIIGALLVMKWNQYNPEWLAKLAEKQLPEEKWLPGAIRKCLKYSIESKAYYHFVSSNNANKPGAVWQFEKNIMLRDPKKGNIVLDILKGNIVGGIEFLNYL